MNKFYMVDTIDCPDCDTCDRHAPNQVEVRRRYYRRDDDGTITAITADEYNHNESRPV